MQISQQATPRQHVVVWLIGAVVASLIPFVFLFFHGLDRAGPPSPLEMLESGELLLISLVLTVGGISELVLVLNKVKQNQILSVALLILGGILLVVGEAAWYADITAGLLDGDRITSSYAIAYGSVGLFVLSGLGSSACVQIAAGAR